MALQDAISEISTRLQTKGYKKTKYSESEASGTLAMDKGFVLDVPDGGPLENEYGKSLYDVSENINVIIWKTITDDYTTSIGLLAADRDTIVNDFISYNSWTGTSGIILVKYEGHETTKESGGLFRDEIQFNVRIRRSF